MQLFVLPPAFGLPSIDAQCIASIALLQLHIGPDSYSIIPTHDEESRPLPYLIDGTAKLSGFNNIARHLLDKRLLTPPQDEKQRADAIAITSFIESNAQTLLDISLYVGFENYRLATRPEYTKVLPWHANYTLPPRRRAAARMRTEHLGISSIDVDDVHEDMSNRPEGLADGVGKEKSFEEATQKRASLLLGGGKQTLKDLLGRPEHAAAFKLNALADNFFEPLEEMLGEKENLLGTDDFTSVDCLVAGYLSLMLFPKLPQDWLRGTMRRKYKKLVAYTERVYHTAGLKTDVDDVLTISKCKKTAEVQELRSARNMTVPWSMPHKPTLSHTLRSFRIGLWNQIPLLGQPHKLHLWNAKWHPFLYRNFRTLMLILVTSVSAMSWLSVYTGVVEWPHGEMIQIFGKRRISDFGCLGAALGGIEGFGV